MDVDFLAQCIAAVITILATLLSVFALPGRKLKFICGSVFIVFGLVWIVLLHSQSVTAKRTSTELQDTLTKINDLQTQLNKSQEELAKAQQVNNELEQRLVASSTNLTQLSRETLSMATGGDSFCVVSLIPTERPYLVAIQAGKYPLYGATAKVIDHKLAGEIIAKYGPTIPGDKLSASETYVTLGDLNQGSGANIPIQSLDGDVSRTFTIFFHARNGDWIERLRLRHVNGHWVQAIKVYKDEYRKNNPRPIETNLYIRVDPEYPTDKGQIDWNN